MIKNVFIVLLIAAAVTAGVVMWRILPDSRPADNSELRNYVNAVKKTDPGKVVGVAAGFIKPVMSGLTAIAVGPGDNIFLGGSAGIEMFDKNGAHIAGIAVSGSVTCIAVAPDGDIFAGVKDHVEIYGRDGGRKAVWASPAPGTELTSIAWSSNFVFVCDYVNRIVWRFSPDGKLSGRIGDKDGDQRTAGFVVPSAYFDVAAAADGSIRVVNPGMHRVEHFTADGKFLSCWGSASMTVDGFCGCCNPTHIALMADGSFVTSEKRIARVKLYDAEGGFNGIISGQEDWPEKIVGLDLAVDSSGRMLVLDPQAGVVRVFTRKP